MKRQKYLQTAFDKVRFNNFGCRQRGQRARTGNSINWRASGTVLCASLLLTLFCWAGGQAIKADTSIGDPREVRVENTTASPGGSVTVNIRVNAVGDESEYGFILSYDQMILSNPVVGAGNAGATVLDCNIATIPQVNCSVGGFPNNNPMSSNSGIGEIGAGEDQILITVTFMVAANAPNGNTPLTLSMVNTSSDVPQLFFPTVENGVVTISGATPTPTPTPTGTVIGRVTYANAPTITGVPFTTINAAGSIPLSTMTDANGFYSLSGFGLGAYTITPSKANQVNGISNLDASLIAQHIVGLTVLNATQLIAADTSGNGTVSSLDASYIAQFVVGIPNPGVTGTWRFLPASRSYPNVMTNQTNQDYSAILLGEVTGNWNPAGPLRPDLLTLQSDQTTQEDKRRQIITIDAQANLSAEAERALTVNLTATNVTDEDILGYQFDLLYDEQDIEPQAVGCDVSETISRGMTAICHAAEPGVLKVVVFGITPMSGTGTLLKLNFKVVRATGSTPALTIRDFMFNESTPLKAIIDGQVSITEPTAVTVSIR